jgi:2',3'-cyclic-nucleotide 2'-phosphodiesterase (5'-nucleotidase family)
MRAFANSHTPLVEMCDLHGTIVSHAAVLKDTDGSEYQVEQSGGLAHLKHLADTIKDDNLRNTLILWAGEITPAAPWAYSPTAMP